MADMATLERALKNADAAGDADAARQIAAEIIRVRQSDRPQPNADGTYGEPPEGMVLDQSTGQMVDTKAFNEAHNKALSEAPWYQRAAQSMDDMGRIFASGVTLGGADKLMGAMGGRGEELERAKTEAARERAGYAAPAGELLGNAVLGAGMANRGMTLMGRVGTAAMPGAKGLAARTALMAGEGAGYGTAAAALNDRDLGEGALYGAAGGAVGNVAGEALSKGLSKVAGMVNKKPAVPSLDDIRTAKSAAYQQADDLGVIYGKDGVNRLRDAIKADFTDFGFLPANQPGAAAVLRELDNLDGQNVTLKGLDTIRKQAGNAYIPGNNSNNALIGKIIDRIDEAIASGDGIIAGQGDEAARVMGEARGLASREAKLRKLSEALEKADLRAASTGSGGNVDNATRQNVRRLVEKPRGFTPDERQAMEKVVRGTPTQNALRLAGKLSPSGNGLMAALGIGGTMVNPLVGALSLGGMAAKSAADRMTQSSADDLARIIAAGGSRAATQAPKNALQRLTEAERETIARALGIYLSGVGANAAAPVSR